MADEKTAKALPDGKVEKVIAPEMLIAKPADFTPAEELHKELIEEIKKYNPSADFDRIEAAYQIACFQIGLTDLDIISSSLAPQNLCTAFILKNGGGRAGLKLMLDALNGPSEANEMMANFLVEQSKDLPFMNQ